MSNFRSMEDASYLICQRDLSGKKPSMWFMARTCQCRLGSVYKTNIIFLKLMESESLGSWRNPNFAFYTNLLLKIAKKQIRPAMPPRPYLCFFAKIMWPEPYLKFNRNWVTKLKPYLREEITLKLYGHPFH